MKYEFNMIEVNGDSYKVNVCIKNSINSTIFEDILEVKYDDNINIVLLDLHYINNVIPNKEIRLSLVSSLKKFIKEYRE